MLGATADMKLTVMIVDDDAATLEIARGLLEDEGHQVITQQVPYGTVARIQRDQPDVVLLDLSMPGIPGDELATLVRQRLGNSTELIFYSGAKRDALARLTQQSGALGYIQKTGNPADFVSSFRDLTASLPAA